MGTHTPRVSQVSVQEKACCTDLMVNLPPGGLIWAAGI